MGKTDVITKAYMKRNEVFADAFNFMMYKGERVIDPERLKPLDTTELAIIPVMTGSSEDNNTSNNNLKNTAKMRKNRNRKKSGHRNGDKTIQKYRDLLKSCVIMQDDQMSYIMLGIENQSDIHYAMPVRNMVYDALQYAGQISEISSRHQHEIREKQTEQYNSRKISQAEYLSGFYKSDRITPVITLVVHFGADNWDGPLSLHDMMSIKDENILSYIQNYKIHLIDPAKLTDQDLTKFQTSLREVLGYIKYSKDKNKLSDYIHDNPRMNLNRDAAMVIKTVTNTNINISEDEE